jgi:glycosyltransferase involved in cell wall biosynthesis
MKRRLLTLGHSYVVSLNRRLAREMTRAGGDEWEVTCAAPKYFHGGNDLAPVTLAPSEADNFELVALDAYLTRRVHVFAYGAPIASLLARPWHFVHAWEEPYIFAGWQISRFVNAEAKLVFRSAQSNPKKYPLPFSWFERSSMARASGWICSGKSVEDNLKARRGYGTPHLLSPLGVDTDVFKPDAVARAEALRRLEWSDPGPPVVGYVGRFVAAKGLRLLMQALEDVREPFRVLFLGSGELEPELRAWAARFPDRARILHVKHDEVPAFVNAMDLLCAPSQTTPQWREQFGRMLVEAFACEVPVIGSDSGEIGTVLGDAGVVVGERDVAGWTQAIEDLLASPDRRQDLGRRSRERAAERYAWPVIAKQYLRFFESLG